MSLFCIRRETSTSPCCRLLMPFSPHLSHTISQKKPADEKTGYGIYNQYDLKSTYTKKKDS